MSMRLWSIHPKYLDAKGLVALWREGLLAQKVLTGQTRGYRNHPQLHRFRNTSDPMAATGKYLYHVHGESLRRGYNFDFEKIGNVGFDAAIDVSSDQVEFEKQHLLAKLNLRDRSLYSEVHAIDELDVHPMFRIVPGPVADWEFIK